MAAGVGMWFFWRWKDDTADRFGGGRALRAISLFSAREITSFTGFWRILAVPSTSRRMSVSYSPFRMTSRMT